MKQSRSRPMQWGSENSKHSLQTVGQADVSMLRTACRVQYSKLRYLALRFLECPPYCQWTVSRLCCWFQRKRLNTHTHTKKSKWFLHSTQLCSLHESNAYIPLSSALSRSLLSVHFACTVACDSASSFNLCFISTTLHNSIPYT